MNMAKNTGKGYRRGAVKNRSEVEAAERQLREARYRHRPFLNQSANPHKGVRDE